MYGGDEEYSLQQRQQSYLPRQAGWPRSAPPGPRPIGGNVFGGNLFGAQPPGYSGSAISGYNDIFAQFMMRLNGGRGFAQG
jgi:hypothetical protein